MLLGMNPEISVLSFGVGDSPRELLWCLLLPTHLMLIRIPETTNWLVLGFC